MPGRRRRPPSEPPWQIILEEIRSQNRATIEAVEANRRVLEQKIDRFDQDGRTRDGLLELALRSLREDLRRTDAKVDRLAGLDARVTALENDPSRT